MWYKVKRDASYTIPTRILKCSAFAEHFLFRFPIVDLRYYLSSLVLVRLLMTMYVLHTLRYMKLRHLQSAVGQLEQWTRCTLWQGAKLNRGLRYVNKNIKRMPGKRSEQGKHIMLKMTLVELEKLESLVTVTAKMTGLDSICKIWC